MRNIHSVKSVQIRSFLWPVFSWTENRKIRTRENPVFGHFSRRGHQQSLALRLYVYTYIQHAYRKFYPTSQKVNFGTTFQDEKCHERFRHQQSLVLRIVFIMLLLRYGNTCLLTRSSCLLTWSTRLSIDLSTHSTCLSTSSVCPSARSTCLSTRSSTRRNYPSTSRTYLSIRLFTRSTCSTILQSFCN